jgi:hypothetical protein
MFKVCLVYLVCFVSLVYLVCLVGLVCLVYDAARKVEGEKSEKGSFLPLDCLNEIAEHARYLFCPSTQ